LHTSVAVGTDEFHAGSTGVQARSGREIGLERARRRDSVLLPQHKLDSGGPKQELVLFTSCKEPGRAGDLAVVWLEGQGQAGERSGGGRSGAEGGKR